jgi:hypothetical protein
MQLYHARSASHHNFVRRRSAPESQPTRTESALRCFPRMTKIKDFSEHSSLSIAIDKVCELILRAKAIDVKEGQTDPDSGSNPTDDGAIDALVATPDDATEEEFREVIGGLNDDERAELIALVYIGRGDMEPGEWLDAVRLAREREAANVLPTAQWLLGIPNLGDLWDEGLAAMGRSCAD